MNIPTRRPLIRPLATALAVAAACTALPAAAYVGPGAGLSLVGALWALVVAVFGALSFVLLWPIRRALRRRRDAMARQSSAPRASEPGKPDPGA